MKDLYGNLLFVVHFIADVFATLIMNMQIGLQFPLFQVFFIFIFFPPVTLGSSFIVEHRECILIFLYWKLGYQPLRGILFFLRNT